jgi:hypothetical protein
VRRGFRWKRHPNLDNKLHYILGFWISLPLFVLSLTGVWISFPQVFAGFDEPQMGPDRGAMMRAKPLAAPATPLALAVEHALAAAPGRVAAVTWPTDLKAVWAIDVAPGKGRPASVGVSDADGVAKVAPPQPQAPQGTSWARLMRQIHDGGDTPFIWQLIIFLGGLIPAVLAVTGIVMWRRARGWRGDLARRRAEASVS